MNNKIALALFALVAVAQCAVPASMILKREWTLEHGTLLRFKCAPVDPYDAFRGRYLAIAVEQNTVPNPKHLMIGSDQRIFATVEIGDDGYAKFTGFSIQRPDEATYLELSVWNNSGGDDLRVRLPFDRYYLEENIAPEAERIYFSRIRSERDAYVTVRVRDGFAVLEELYVEDTPILEYVRKQSADTPTDAI
jgi:uncharacterized membrane-anchored protein